MRALKLLSLPALFLVNCPVCRGKIRQRSTATGTWPDYGDTTGRMRGDNWLLLSTQRTRVRDLCNRKSIQLISAKENLRCLTAKFHDAR